MSNLSRYLLIPIGFFGLMACRKMPPEPLMKDSSAESFQGMSSSEFWNQSPEQVNTLLGSVPSIDAQNPNDAVVPYSPIQFQSFFPKEEVDSLNVSFKDSKAVQVSLRLKGPLTDIGYGSIPGDEETAIALTTRFYQALFPKESPNFRLLRATDPGESLQVYTYCLNNQIATSLISGQLYELALSLEPDCNEKPES